MNTQQSPIFERNLSRAWAKVFLELIKPGKPEVHALSVTVAEFNNNAPEDEAIRKMLDDTLRGRGCFDCHTVANTIFPLSLWNPKRERAQLFERYLRVLPQLKKLELQRNKHGLYFEKMVSFGKEEFPINQLEHVIQTYQDGNHRRSALQVTIFDPARDHTNQRQRGFPCLHQVFFTPFADDELVVTGIYATQDIFSRAYGNYVGLCRLGQFVAHELGLRLTQMTCFANIARLGDTVHKTDLDIQALKQQVEVILYGHKQGKLW
jgi:thymidylate synthase